MKFKILADSQRVLERVFDAGLILVFTGILLQRDVSGDFIFFGAMLLSWCVPCFILQRGWVKNRARTHVLALLFIIVVFVIYVALL